MEQSPQRTPCQVTPCLASSGHQFTGEEEERVLFLLRVVPRNLGYLGYMGDRCSCGNV